MCHHLRVYAVIFIIVLRRKKTNQQEWHTRLSMLTELINPTETGTVVYTTEDDAVYTHSLCSYVDVFLGIKRKHQRNDHNKGWNGSFLSG